MKRGLSKHCCRKCGKAIIPYREGYILCENCFFNSRRCNECGRPIRPYKEGYTKCRRCFLKSEQAIRNRTLRYLDNLDKPVQNFSEQTKWKNKEESRKNPNHSFLKYSLIILVIIFLVFVIFKAGIIHLSKPELNCSDGTKYDSCSPDKPLYCFNGTLMNNSSRCGCPQDYRANGNDCELIPRCSDKTVYGDCSSNKPFYCYYGALIEKASLCGCPEENLPNGEACVSKYEINPKTINLRNFNYVVYGGVDDYLAGLSRTMWYTTGESAPTTKDFILRDLNNEIQRKYLLPFVQKIKDESTDKKEQARITINIVQGIPYDMEAFNTNSVSGRYPYEVLYDMKGVCMEKADLLAFTLRELGFGVAIFEFQAENHRAVGIECSDGNYNSDYCFIESTDYYPVGQIPYEYVGGVNIRNAIPEVVIISEGDSFS